jgi:outer membrane protein assembly factor BamE (lipoprotein component of BamABCDE complex)
VGLNFCFHEGNERLGYHSGLILTQPLSMRVAFVTVVSFIASCCLLLSGCGIVYKMEINQGNYVTQDMVEKLREGQTRQQVKFILGTPTTESVFHADRWDYNFSLERRGSKITSHQLTVLFDGDKLKKWDVKDLPTVPVVDRDPAYAKFDKEGKPADGSWWDSITGWWKK